MRRDGRKLDWAVVKSSEPVRGRLWVDTLRREGDGSKPMSASLLGNGNRVMLPMLDRVRVKVKNGQLMVLGYELGNIDRREERKPQAWWCRIVPDQYLGLMALDFEPAGDEEG